MIRFLLVLALFMNPYSARSNDQAVLSPVWLKLMHMKKTFPLGHLRSEVDSPEFFFSPEGNRSAEKELTASIDTFRKDPKLQCIFPARFEFLNREYALRLPSLPCPDLDNYLERIGGDQVSLIFSSAYPNSPPSMFGHTFLRFHKNGREILLDESINFAAQAAPDENAVLFAVFGLMGGYYGNFGVAPYYMKVNEYAHAESRDLWEYDLTLNPAEIRFFLKHIWELNQKGFFKYFFFDENCSYRILTLLEIVKPEWPLSDFAIHVIPAETVKRVLKIPDAVSQIHYRPSLSSEMKPKWDLLSSKEKKQAWKIIESETFDAEPNVQTLEAVLAYYQYQKLKNKNVLEPHDQKKFTRLLIARSKLGQTAPVKITEPIRPDQGHAPYKISLGQGWMNAHNTRHRATLGFQEFQFKFAYHDILNDDRGYIPFSHIDFPSVTLRYSDKINSLWVERLSVFSVTSISPWSAFERPLSWKVDLAYTSPKDLSCVDCHAGAFEGGVGEAFGIFSNRVLIYGLGLLHFEYGTAIQNSFRFLPQFQSGVLAQVFSNYKIQGAFSFVHDAWQSSRRDSFFEAQLNQAFHLDLNWEIRLMSKAIRSKPSQKSDAFTESTLSLIHYY